MDSTTGAQDEKTSRLDFIMSTYFLDDQFLAVSCDRWRVYYSGPISFISRQHNMNFFSCNNQRIVVLHLPPSSRHTHPFIHPFILLAPVLLPAFSTIASLDSSFTSSSRIPQPQSFRLVRSSFACFRFASSQELLPGMTPPPPPLLLV